MLSISFGYGADKQQIVESELHARLRDDVLDCKETIRSMIMVDAFPDKI